MAAFSNSCVFNVVNSVSQFNFQPDVWYLSWSALQCYESALDDRVSLWCVSSVFWVEVTTNTLTNFHPPQLKDCVQNSWRQHRKSSKGSSTKGSRAVQGRTQAELFHHLVQQPIALSCSPFHDFWDGGKSCCTFNRNVPALKLLCPFGQRNMLYSKY